MKRQPTTLESRMILHRFMCMQFGYYDLRQMLNIIENTPQTSEEHDRTYLTQRILDNYTTRMPIVTVEDMFRYDDNIMAHSKTLGIDRNDKTWKPFQYLALLFTERYLDLYFTDAEDLVIRLNRWIKIEENISIKGYTRSDIRTLAFQSATGSGKTLLLHANILQYKHYMKQFGRAHKLNKIILVTPDEGLSRQHLAELDASGFTPQLFSDSSGGLFARGGDIVDIIDLHKLDEKKGIKRVSLDAFEDNNLVMVDEGHLGTGGKVWRKRRKQLARNGFTFEYSATFNQAVAGSGDEPKRLRDEYGKSILFDYAYKHFYADGYGKDYRITNLQNTDDGEANNHYLLACALTFYQQCQIHATKGDQWREFNIAPPLWVFLGQTVTGGKTTGKSKTESDVIRIVLFLAWVLSNRQKVTAIIKQLIGDNSGLIDADEKDIFSKSFSHISDSSPSKIYDNLCAKIFRGKGQLKISHLTVAHELQLSVGDSLPFGVINVGDASGLYTKLDAIKDKNFALSKNAFTKPLFAEVDQHHSPVTIVIGARRFVAGWNSWRVSTMGLMNVGRSEGPQIIQMFGRGVRLKGHNMSLKRHTALEIPRPPDSSQLKLLETLNIFGLKADYMDKFKEYLKNADVSSEQTIFTLPVKKQFSDVKHLKILQKSNSAGEYKYSTERVILPDSPDAGDTVTLNRHKHIQIIESTTPQHDGIALDMQIRTLEPRHVALLNKMSIYHRILERKQRACWYNMTIDQETVNALLDSSEWYELYIPAEKLEPTSYGRVQEWEELAVDLICEYANRYWRRKRNTWEHEHLEAVPLNDNNSNYFDEYKLAVDPKEEQLIKDIKQFIDAVKQGNYKRRTVLGNHVSIFTPPFHAYIPLFYASTKAHPVIKIYPLALNEGENNFVHYLTQIVKDTKFELLKDKNIYFMRNLGSGRGVSFFDDYGFYPDFIVWVEDSQRQDILFIDPKGLAYYNPKIKSKVELHKCIKDTEDKVKEKHPKLFLHSYIWSVTPRKHIGSDEKLSSQECRAKGIYLSNGGTAEMKALLEHALTSPASSH